MKYTSSLEVVETGDSYHILTQVRINGINKIFILDTGASHSVIDKSSISLLNLVAGESELKAIGIVGEIDIGLCEIRFFEIEEFTLMEYNITVIDLFHIDIYSDFGEKAIGILGNDFLYKYNAIINLETNTLTLSK